MAMIRKASEVADEKKVAPEQKTDGCKPKAKGDDRRSEEQG
jgi:hypothetical protein